MDQAAGGAPGAKKPLSELSKMIEYMARMLVDLPDQVEINEIDERGKRTLSMMPEKLVDGLTVNQLASLLAYLESLKAK